jgi:hypothetical protein
MSREAAPRSADDRAHLRRRVFWRRAVVDGARWLYGALGHLLFVVGLLALAGVVVVFDWPVWLIALVVALIVLAGLAEGTYQAWRESASDVLRRRSAELSDETLHSDCAVTSASIQSFVLQRKDSVPSLPPDKAMMLANKALPPAEEFDYKWAVVGHEHETLTRYREEFGARVFKIVVALRQRGYVPDSISNG